MGVGPEDAEIMIVGQNPGGREDMAGRPFVGKAGGLLRGMLGDAGLDFDRCFVTNAVRCRTPEDRKPTDAEISANRAVLIEEIQRVRPKIIIALGDVAMKSLLKKGGLKDKRGQDYPLHAEFGYECPVFVTYHPAFVLRVPQARTTVVSDFRKVRDRNKPDDAVPWVRGVPSVPIGADDWVAWDVETDFFETGGDHITQMAMACDAWDNAFVVEGTYPVGIAFGGRTVTHNGWRFDVPVLLKNGVQAYYGRDTQILAYLDDETQPQNLEALCVKYLGVKGWKEGLHAEQGSDEFALYNARDAHYTLELHEVLTRRLGDRVAIADKIMLPAYIALQNAERYGVFINLDKVLEVEAEVDAEIAKHAALLKDKYGLENPGSPDQVRKALLRAGYMLTATTPQGKLATDKAVLKALTGELPETLLAWRKANKAKTTYVTPYKKAAMDGDGRIHAEYKFTRTLTGRTTARTQQLDRRFKKMYSAPKGRVRISADYSAIEFRLGAWVADEQSILERYSVNPNWDPHKYFAGLFYGKPEDEVTTDENGERQVAKSANFSQLYMGTGKTMVDYAGKMGVTLTIGQANKIHQAWHRTFPGFKALYARVAKSIRDNGYVETATGFRRHFGDVSLMNPIQFAEAVRQGTNVLVQGLAAHVAFVALGVIDQAGLQIVDFVHDSIGVEVDDDPETIMAAKLLMRTAMVEIAPQFLKEHFGVNLDNIPLTVDFTETRI